MSKVTRTMTVGKTVALDSGTHQMLTSFSFRSQYATWMEVHAWPDVNTLVYLCFGCGSIGTSASQVARDILVDNYDFGCCGPTVVFHTEED